MCVSGACVCVCVCVCTCVVSDGQYCKSVMYQCIVMHSVSMHVSILHQCINLSMYRWCVLINKIFSVLDKSFEITFCMRKTLVQYGNSFA